MVHRDYSTRLVPFYMYKITQSQISTSFEKTVQKLSTAKCMETSPLNQQKCFHVILSYPPWYGTVSGAPKTRTKSLMRRLQKPFTYYAQDKTQPSLHNVFAYLPCEASSRHGIVRRGEISSLRLVKGMPLCSVAR